MAQPIMSYVGLLCLASFVNLQAAIPLEECNTLFANAEYKAAIPSCTLASDAGDHSAQTMLGEIYDTEGNSEKTAELWGKAADAGYQPARNLLALKYYYGGTVLGAEEGWDKDYSKAFKIWMDDSVKEVATSQFMIGVMYQKGLSVKMDLSESYYWLQRSLGNGYKLSTDVLIEISHDISPLEKQLGKAKLAEYQKQKASK